MSSFSKITPVLNVIVSLALDTSVLTAKKISGGLSNVIVGDVYPEPPESIVTDLTVP